MATFELSSCRVSTPSVCRRWLHNTQPVTQPFPHRWGKVCYNRRQRFLKFLEVKNDYLIRVSSSNNECFIGVYC